MRDEVLGQVGASRLALIAAIVVIAAVDLSCASSPLPAPPPTVAIASVASDLALVIEPGPGADPVAPRRPAGPTAIAWETDDRVAHERARRQGLPMLIWVRADWAASALQMERTAWSDPRVVSAARRFVALALDVSAAEGDAELYAQRYAIQVMPSTLIFDASGRRIATLRGATSADALLAAMREE